LKCKGNVLAEVAARLLLKNYRALFAGEAE